MTRAAKAMIVAVLLAAVWGCQQAAIEENKKQVAAMQTQIEDLQKQLAALQVQQAYPAANVPSNPVSCDQIVMDTATRRAAEALAAGEMGRARGYYQDAVTACPTNARAQVNLARIYEKMGDRTKAVAHYRAAAGSANSDAAAAQDARGALLRLGVSN